MAASVLLGSAADNTGLNFSGGGVGGAGNSVTAGPGHHHGLGAPWNRSLDRALEEAAATGSLNLSGRKLKEFPPGAANHDLTDTTRADLSRNRLPELPVEVCLFVSLESLNLYQNCLRSLPESLVNLQALTSINISRNQLSVLPPVVCSLPLKVLIACNNKLVSLPEEIGQLRHLTELDVSCNEIQTLPPQVGQLEALRDLNIRRNHLVRLPPELSELPLVRLDFSCNKVTQIPVCFRRLNQLQSIVLDNNPLQTPPAQICMKGKVHIFKYLNLEASKSPAELPEFDRRPLNYNHCGDELYPGRSYGALDSGFNSVDSGDKRWSGNEPSEEDLSSKVAELSREQRHRGLHNGAPYPESEQIDFIDSSATEEEEEEGRRQSLSSQFMAYIEKRITREGSPVKSGGSRTDERRLHRSVVDGVSAPSAAHIQRSSPGLGPGGVERMRREAQLAAQKYDNERHKNTRTHNTTYTKLKAQSPSKSSSETEGEDRTALSPTGSQSTVYPCRPDSYLHRLNHKDDKRRGESAPAPEKSPALEGQDAELVEQLRKNIEARLKVALPTDLGAALTDGVVLCHLANHVRPRSVPSIHVPSPAVPKLTMAKCRRNVENFLEACRRIGVPQSQLCLPLHILEEKGLPLVAGTVSALLQLAPPRHSVTTTTSTTATPPPSM
ncbi:DISP complex protein LRCH3 isoform X2 [Periophthalmus magnuspinnatus]|uniref:DISP complex protein LRCH3 isoform X2 n=1 Tax=Periophthalmus magnuspinnatus TaxID=409849 RepID=UPI002436E809|nr:DISP complex protein LRCH3 isoform X2 [Periophthalmus magnuspinnatus]